MIDFEKLAQARASVRAFLPQAVAKNTVQQLIEVARLAPSGGNLQPGHFWALTGTPLQDLCGAILKARAFGRAPVSEYDWFPKQMPKQLKERQRNAGYGLYNALGINRADRTGRNTQFDRNYQFFDAPVGIVITLDRSMGAGAFLDLGMALSHFCLAATATGLATCGIGALANHADVVQENLNIPKDQMVICGMALGYENKTAPANQWRTGRVDFSHYLKMNGFDDEPNP
jgi:nitroreductase